VEEPEQPASSRSGSRDDASWEFEEGHEIAPGRSVLSRIGGGHLYEVYLVWDDRRFAVMVAKVVRPDQVGDASADESLRREWDALSRLAHPVVVRGFDAVLDGPYPHVLVEHLEGPPLRSLLRRGSVLGMEQALPLALSLASALHYFAAEGMLHLDVKPANVIMGLPPRLIDLSVSHTIESAARITGLYGTDGYMAPEQCDPGNRGPIGPPADVWGLGATLFHAIAGKLPFPRYPDARLDLLDERFPQLVEEPDFLPTGTPEQLAQAILASLRPDPAERPAAAELALALEPLVAALPHRIMLSRRGWQMH
jgi:serine/threonine protein kinase